jgi:hypothetical protein
MCRTLWDSPEYLAQGGRYGVPGFRHRVVPLDQRVQQPHQVPLGHVPQEKYRVRRLVLRCPAGGRGWGRGTSPTHWGRYTCGWPSGARAPGRRRPRQAWDTGGWVRLHQPPDDLGEGHRLVGREVLSRDGIVTTDNAGYHHPRNGPRTAQNSTPSSASGERVRRLRTVEDLSSEWGTSSETLRRLRAMTWTVCIARLSRPLGLLPAMKQGLYRLPGRDALV